VSILEDQNYKPMLERGKTYLKISNLSQDLFGTKTRMLNLTGGHAIDQYLRIPGVGGIHSAYVISNDHQEIDWLKRLKEIDPNFVLGGYGSLGSAAFDGSGLGGRAPKVLSWLTSKYSIVDCGDFLVGVKTKMYKKLSDTLLDNGCLPPPGQRENLETWQKMDSTQADLGYSLLTWPKSGVKEKIGFGRNSKSIQIRELRENGVVTFGIKCLTQENVHFLISNNDLNSPLEFSFFAQIRSGEYSFKPNIFPITSLLRNSFKITLLSSQCNFV
jgi:hypothetical protein